MYRLALTGCCLSSFGIGYYCRNRLYLSFNPTTAFCNAETNEQIFMKRKEELPAEREKNVETSTKQNRSSAEKMASLHGTIVVTRRVVLDESTVSQYSKYMYSLSKWLKKRRGFQKQAIFTSENVSDDSTADRGNGKANSRVFEALSFEYWNDPVEAKKTMQLLSSSKFQQNAQEVGYITNFDTWIPLKRL